MTYYRNLEEKPIPSHRNILRDQIIEMEGFYTRQKYPGKLRRIEVWDEENEKVIVLLTNHMTFGATTIAATYRDQWQIEIFFKTIKKNLRIKTFVGTSPNELLIQIWTALISDIRKQNSRIKYGIEVHEAASLPFIIPGRGEFL
jgi:hypothetical protein